MKACHSRLGVFLTLLGALALLLPVPAQAWDPIDWYVTPHTVLFGESVEAWITCDDYYESFYEWGDDAYEDWDSYYSPFLHIYSEPDYYSITLAVCDDKFCPDGDQDLWIDYEGADIVVWDVDWQTFGSQIDVETDQTAGIYYWIYPDGYAVDNVKATVTDAFGDIVNEDDALPTDGGTFSWDGSGATEDGDYDIELVITNGGVDVPASHSVHVVDPWHWQWVGDLEFNPPEAAHFPITDLPMEVEMTEGLEEWQDVFGNWNGSTATGYLDFDVDPSSIPFDAEDIDIEATGVISGDLPVTGSHSKDVTRAINFDIGWEVFDKDCDVLGTPPTINSVSDLPLTVNVEGWVDEIQTVGSGNYHNTKIVPVTFNIGDISSTDPTAKTITFLKDVAIPVLTHHCGTVTVNCKVKVTINVIKICTAPGPAGGYNPINLVTGEYQLIATDFTTTNDAGLPLFLFRRYNNQALYTGSFGRNWTMNFDARVREFPDGTVEYIIPCRSNNYNYGLQLYFIPDGQGGYAPPVGSTDQLVKPAAGGYEITTLDVGIFEFDDSGALQGVRNSAGQRLACEYTAGKLRQVTDPYGRSLQFRYNNYTDTELKVMFADVADTDTSDSRVILKNGLVREVTDPLGNAYRYEYDRHRNLVRVIPPAGSTSEYRYAWDPVCQECSHNMIYRFDPAQRVAELWTDYDTFSRVIRERDANGVVQAEYTYDFRDGQFQPVYRNALGGEQQLEVSGSFAVTRVTSEAGDATQYERDALGRPVATTDPLGNVTRFEYPAGLRTIGPSRTIHPLGNEVIREYDPVWPGKPTLEVTRSADGAELARHEWRYDPATGLLVREAVKLNGSEWAITLYEYDGMGRLTRKTDPLGNETVNEYDANGHLRLATEPLGKATESEYNALGWLVTKTDPLGYVTTYDHDGRGKVVAVHYPDGSTERFEYDGIGRKVAEIDRLGHRTIFAYNLEGKPILRTDPLGGITENQYNLIGRRIRTVNELGVGTAYEYDPAGRLLAEVRDDAGLCLTTRYVYDAVGRRVEEVKPNGAHWLSTYDANGRRTNQRDPLGYTTAWEYDGADRMVGTVDPDGNVTRQEYDLAGRVIATIDGEGNRTEYGYDLLDRRTERHQPNGNIARHSYDTLGRLVQTEDGLGLISTATYDLNGNRLTESNTDGISQRMTYDNMGRVTTTADALGNITQLVYDAAGQRTALTDPLGNVVRWEYDDLGRSVCQTDPLGNATQFRYDAAGRLVETIDALNNSRQTEYNALGWLTRQIDPMGHAFTKEYDALGNVVAMRDALGNVTRFEYDLAGRQTAMTDPTGARVGYEYAGGQAWTRLTNPLGNVTERRYDRNGRLTAETRYLDGQPLRTGIGYDALGNKTSETDAAGHATSYFYDLRGRMIGMTDALGGMTGYGYDAVGRLIGITDPAGSITRREYDRVGRMTAEVDALGNRTEYEYDVVGNLVHKETADGLVAAMTYDAARRLLREDWPGTADDISYSYDALGRRTTVAGEVNHRAATVNYAYDAAGQLTGVDYGWLGSVAYQYDAAGNRTKLTDSYGGEVRYAYDSARRLATLNDGTEYVFGYNAAGLRTGLRYPNGVQTTTDYNALGWITKHENSGVNRFDYTYDILGNRLTMTDDRGVNRYVYDALSQLTSVEYPDGSYERFIYDSVGNRLLLQTAVDTTVYTYNQGHQLIAEGGKVYEYDQRGNLVSITGGGVTNTFAYNSRNRMTRGDSGVENVYGYGPDGERWYARTTAGEQYFLYADKDIICELDGNLRPVTRYTHGPGIDEPLKATDYDPTGNITQTNYLHRDALGSVTSVSDGNGALVVLYHYAAFGNPAEPGNHLRYRFTSREWEGDLYLYYYRARMYDPRVGRIYCYDPIPYNRVEFTENYYEYCGNNPIVRIDPYGQKWTAWDFFWKYVYDDPKGDVDLDAPDVELLDDYKSQSQVLDVVSTAKWSFLTQAQAVISSGPPPSGADGSFPVSGFKELQFTDVFRFIVPPAWPWLDPLHPLGTNNLYYTGTCHYLTICDETRFKCDITFTFTDPFSDVFNMEHLIGTKFEFGTPYNMTGTWSEKLDVTIPH